MPNTPDWIEDAARELFRDQHGSEPDQCVWGRQAFSCYLFHLRAAAERAVSAAPQPPASAGDVEAAMTAIAQALPITLDDCVLRPAATAILAAMVRAMREPSEAVICAIDEAIIAALNAPLATDKTPGEVAWQAGIDAMLAEMREKP